MPQDEWGSLKEKRSFMPFLLGKTGKSKNGSTKRAQKHSTENVDFDQPREKVSCSSVYSNRPSTQSVFYCLKSIINRRALGPSLNNSLSELRYDVCVVAN